MNPTTEQHAAHTPGPWAAKPARMLRAVAIVSASGPVATTSAASTVSRETNLANARLAAAAPELLAALQRVAALPGFEPDKPYGVAARAAIAKATGKAQP